MKAPAALPLFGDAYMADTRHLSLAEHGAYLLLMMIAWRSDGCKLPDDDRRIAAMLGTTGAKWAKMKPTIMALWTLDDGFWTQGRLTKERNFVDEKRNKNSQAAETRWSAKPRKTKGALDANAYADAMQTECPYSPTPLQGKSSEAKASAQIVQIDPIKALFERGVKLLTASGVPEKQARALVGRWRKDHGDGQLLEAIIACEARHITNPVEWISARWSRGIQRPRNYDPTSLEATAPAL